MRRTALLLPALLVPALLGAPVAATPAATLARDAALLAREEPHGDCDQLQPAPAALDRLGAAAAGEPGSPLRMDLLVVTERRLLEGVRRDVALAARSYAEVGVQVVARYRLVPSVPDLDEDSAAYLDWLKARFGGRRPAGTDVVYLATDRFLGSAGLADCIGGIAHDEHAFAVGMTTFDGLVGVEVGGVDEPAATKPAKADGGALLVVHEIGHLFGAHHHYGYYCAHARSAEDTARPCDVMDTLLPQQTGLRFGTVNAAVVREQAERFLR